jgi:hypothetical protein
MAKRVLASHGGFSSIKLACQLFRCKCDVNITLILKTVPDVILIQTLRGNTFWNIIDRLIATNFEIKELQYGV